MNRRLWISFGLVAIALGITPATRASDVSPAARIPWRFNLEQAHAEAQKANKPLLVVIGAPWCQYSRKLDTQTLSNPEIIGVIQERFVPVLVSFDRNREIARKLEVKSLPCTIVLSPEADLLGRLVGHVEADQYKEALVASWKLQGRVQQVRYQQQGE